ncbi:hypothetical protein D3C85_1039130 [compost metagenome]
MAGIDGDGHAVRVFLQQRLLPVGKLVRVLRHVLCGDDEQRLFRGIGVGVALAEPFEGDTGRRPQPLPAERGYGAIGVTRLLRADTGELAPELLGLALGCHGPGTLGDHQRRQQRQGPAETHLHHASCPIAQAGRFKAGGLVIIDRQMRRPCFQAAPAVLRRSNRVSSSFRSRSGGHRSPGRRHARTPPRPGRLRAPAAPCP